MSDSLDKAAAKHRALKAWELMTDNEKAMVRIGMSPHWTVLEDMGGKADPSECFEEVKGRDAHRLLTLALMDLTKDIGGMVV